MVSKSIKQDPRVLISLDPNDPDYISVGMIGKDMNGNEIKFDKPEDVAKDDPKNFGKRKGHIERGRKTLEVVYTERASSPLMYYIWLPGVGRICIPC